MAAASISSRPVRSAHDIAVCGRARFVRSDWSGSEPLQRVVDILDALRRLQSYTSGITKEEFLSDEMRRDATIRALEVLSEAVRHLKTHAPDFEERYPDVQFRRRNPRTIQRGSR